MKKNWIIILIVFLLTANAGLIATLLISNSRQNEASYSNKFDKNYRNIPNHKQGRFEEHIANQLGLSDLQKDKLHVLSTDFHVQKDALNDKIFSLREKYFIKLSASDTSNYLLVQLADSLGLLHASMMKLDYEHYKNIKTICTAQQATKFDSLGRMHMNKIKGENCLNERRRHRYSDN